MDKTKLIEALVAVVIVVAVAFVGYYFLNADKTLNTSFQADTLSQPVGIENILKELEEAKGELDKIKNEQVGEGYQKDIRIRALEEGLRLKEKELFSLKQALDDAGLNFSRLAAEKADLNALLESSRNDAHNNMGTQDDKIKELQAIISARESRIAGLVDELTAMAAAKEKFKEQLDKIKKSYEADSADKDKLEEKIVSFSRQVSEKEEEIASLKNKLNSQDYSSRDSFKREIEDYRKNIDRLTGLYGQLKAKIKETESIIARKDEEAKNKDKYISALEDKISRFSSVNKDLRERLSGLMRLLQVEDEVVENNALPSVKEKAQVQETEPARAIAGQKNKTEELKKRVEVILRSAE